MLKRPYLNIYIILKSQTYKNSHFKNVFVQYTHCIFIKFTRGWIFSNLFSNGAVFNISFSLEIIPVCNSNLMSLYDPESQTKCLSNDVITIFFELTQMFSLWLKVWKGAFADILIGYTHVSGSDTITSHVVLE